MGKIFTIADGLENMGALRTGGQGSVYKGRRMGPVLSAVKILPTPIYAESAEDKNYLRFLNEVEKLKKVNEIPNPNVVKIFNFGITESGSLPYIEMEFIEGPDLEELLKSPHEPIFTIKEVIKVADQLACALSHCHSVGVKHGDVKSNNVKFNIHSGNYVLLDFGLSVMSEEERRSSMRHAGAIEFMAPEQNEGQMLFQTDVYSYGVILFELLTGQVPFPLKDNGETARNTVMVSHMEAPVPDILELRRQNIPESWSAAKREHEMGVPAWLLTMVVRCLEKIPEGRYSSGIELHDTLVLNSTSTLADGGTAAILRGENEQLQAVVQRYREEAKKESTGIRISKNVLGVLVLLSLLGIMVLARPIFFTKNNANLPAGDSLTKVTPVNLKSVSPKPVEKTEFLPDTNNTKKDTSGINIPNYDSVSHAGKLADQKKKHHKKRKKFLGIF
ncbi:serine/threonine-protein kinase [uncultured Mucilaginibacter sp.]|uniref:serine/threonine protein kinase n=1 Tax=uncultured Mucilaginibacter sp. TaxID=797541 RepID=UPI0025E75119|nr:serine/threonine-protein kinase [uncultured Mucilaginibacter sp.]